MESKIIRVGIVGCGRIAEHHLRFLSENCKVKVVALSDPDSARTKKLAERYNVAQQFGSLEQMLGATHIDAVHILTPPSLHAEQAATAIEAGVHVMIEKPVAYSAQEVSDLYARAARKNVKLCPDFIQLFHPAVEQISEAIASGRFGSVIHVESFMGVEAALPELREWPGLHWSFDLPGGVLHNYITHPLYLTMNWIGAPRNINVSSRNYGALPHGLTDHVEVSIEGERATASVVVSFAMSQAPFSIKVYCEKGSLTANFDTMSLVVNPNSRLPRPARRLFQNISEAKQLAAGTVKTVWGVVRKKIVPYEGLRLLFERFYNSIESGAPLPVSEDLVLHTAEAEDFIVANSGKVHLTYSDRTSTIEDRSAKLRVLVTGASGFVGKVLVQHLLEQGFNVRALVRPLGNVRSLEALDIEIFYGDVRDRDQLRRAVQDVDVIMHLAAGVRGSRPFACSSCTQGTENIAVLARECGVKRVIYVSSMAIHDFLKLKEGEVIRETSPLESRPELRSTYAHAKRDAEDIAISQVSQSDPSWTIVRPSVIFGRGWNPLPTVGVKLGRRLVSLGSRRKLVRLIHVDDACDAMIAILQSPESAGKILNLSHPDEMETGEFAKSVVSRYDAGLSTTYLPGGLLMTVASLGEFALKVFRLPLLINRRRMAYLVRSNPVDGTALRSLGIWTPKESLREQLAREIGPVQTTESTPSSLKTPSSNGTSTEASAKYREESNAVPVPSID